jgi:hypothetical protein
VTHQALVLLLARGIYVSPLQTTSDSSLRSEPQSSFEAGGRTPASPATRRAHAQWVSSTCIQNCTARPILLFGFLSAVGVVAFSVFFFIGLPTCRGSGGGSLAAGTGAGTSGIFLPLAPRSFTLFFALPILLTLCCLWRVRWGHQLVWHFHLQTPEHSRFAPLLKITRTLALRFFAWTNRTAPCFPHVSRGGGGYYQNDVGASHSCQSAEAV